MSDLTTYLNVKHITAENCDECGGPAYVGQWFGYIIQGATEYAGDLYPTSDAAVAQLRQDATDLGLTDLVVTYAVEG